MAGVSSEMRASMEASISVEVDEAGKACDFELSKILTGQAGDIVSVQDLNVKESRWKFTNQKLTQLTITLPAYQPAVIEPNVAKEISFLVEAYGPPTTDKMVPYQNAYGARWDCREVIWTMPDGVQIAAGESIRNTDQGPRRGLLIVFTSKNGGNKQPERNPYVR